ncbi:MAG: hypothetical protein NT027_07625 [Proteobacteria bacterium]|nr:hypothetical protein [Pseudomonadota bacterium]
MKLNFKSLVLTIMPLKILMSCQAPSEPASLKNDPKPVAADAAKDDDAEADDETNTAKKITGPAKGLKFIGGGAPVGDVQAKLKECVATKKFFDRSSTATNKCTSLPLAEVGCTPVDIVKALTETQAKTLEGYLAADGKLAGFLLDQCLDCSDPVANEKCKGTTNPPTNPGMRLFFVKLDTATKKLSSQSLFVQYLKE